MILTFFYEVKIKGDFMKKFTNKFTLPKFSGFQQKYKTMFPNSELFMK